MHRNSRKNKTPRKEWNAIRKAKWERRKNEIPSGFRAIDDCKYVIQHTKETPLIPFVAMEGKPVNYKREL